MSANFLIMLNEPAGGGVGSDQNVVAFNSFCTHQGGPLAGQFQGDKGIAGPCPLHWTTFDLTRHGMVISGHATQGLPQILLEVDGDDIVATGVMGLIFGYVDNKENPAEL
jgi:arsenite oxidase small subunit